MAGGDNVMPLRDHFRSPLDDQHSWDELHGLWPGVIVLDLNRKLPGRYVAAPTVHIGSLAQIDVVAFDCDSSGSGSPHGGVDEGGVATAVWAPPKPTVEIAADLTGQDEYEIRIYDTKRNRRLVAAVELVSPSNKDRADSRCEFVAKCAALLRERVSVAIVDVVTSRHANLYAELLELAGGTDPTLGSESPAVYAAECRWIGSRGSGRLQTWSHTLKVGQPLPKLPLWLSDTYGVELELEITYEETCRGLRIA
jgi:hypothetical protein